MPLIYFSRVSEDRIEFFFAHDSASTSNNPCMDFESEYKKLPDVLKSCLDYCSFAIFYRVAEKDELVRLLVAEDLVQQIPGKTMEEVAEAVLEDLISLGMLRRERLYNTLTVDGNYKKVCLVRVEEKDFVALVGDAPVFAYVEEHGKDIPPDFQGLQVRSLFIWNLEKGWLRTKKEQGLSHAYMESVCRLQSLVVLDLEGSIECLPDRVGNMVHLRYLRLYHSELDEFPQSLFDLQKLQTLDCRFGSRHMQALPVEALKMKQLRHLLISRSIRNEEVRVPEGFGSMENLHTCDGVYGGGGTAQQLGNLIQLRKLSVRRVAHDHSDELAAAIAILTNLEYLSLQAEGGYWIDSGSLLPEMEQFSAPLLLRELHLVGGLTDIPSWVFAIQNLTTLSLSYSGLLENDTSLLQTLPNLKHLYLLNAFNAKYMGKAFCDPGGFKELETLIIQSRILVSWSETLNGAFPSLRVLIFYYCDKLRFLPEGLQNISTLQHLRIWPAYNDIKRRLFGQENYKIKHIKDVSIEELPPSSLGHQ